MTLLNGLEGVKVFSACRTDHTEWVLERLFVRIHKTMETWDSHAALIIDEGKEAEITRLLRKLGVYNPVQVYVAPGVTELRNLKLSRILEDPFFKSSARSYFVQMADFAAYALLRQECPMPSKNKYDYDTVFGLLNDVFAREASNHDPQGVIR